MDKSGVFVGATVGSISVFIIFTALFILPVESDETAIQMQNQIDKNELQIQNQIDVINNIILTESKTLSLIEIFEKSEPGVVRVNTQRNQTINDVGGVGSGFVFDKKGHIITNAHVIDDSTKTVVTFLDGRSYNAQIIGIDQYTDIGVIKVNADLKLLQPLTLGDSSNLQVGEPITAIGNPFGLSGSMTSGIISQMGRLLPTNSGFQIPDVIQTDAAINP
ncbi:MAG: trypsin-like peptidase domain-containing protein, partial [Nitrosopumilus sp.]|nr:trypsin-like peptidase domain-containing protein [Nitrosopumilus sp.]